MRTGEFCCIQITDKRFIVKMSVGGQVGAPFVLLCLELNIWVKARHIWGLSNIVADALSRFQFGRFRELVPWAEEVGEKCPDHLWGIIWS